MSAVRIESVGVVHSLAGWAAEPSVMSSTSPLSPKHLRAVCQSWFVTSVALVVVEGIMGAFRFRQGRMMARDQRGREQASVSQGAPSVDVHAATMQRGDISMW